MLVCNDGMFFALEVKQRGNRPTLQQTRVMESIRRSGGTAGVVHDVEEALELCGL